MFAKDINGEFSKGNFITGHTPFSSPSKTDQFLERNMVEKHNVLE